MKKKSQVTIFIILGILIVIVLGFFLFIRTLIVESEFDEEKTANIDISGRINTITDSCAENILTQAVLILGKSGGMIYTVHPTNNRITSNLLFADTNINAHPNFKHGKHVNIYENPAGNIEKINYGIGPGFGIPGYELGGPFQEFNFPWKYPRDVYEFTSPRAKYFGNNTLPKLCSKEGQNHPDSGNLFINTCDDDSLEVWIGSDLTAQEQIEKYISREIINCIDTTLTNSDIGGGLSISPSQRSANAEIVFSDEEILAFGEASFFLIQGDDESKQTSSFSVKIRTRMQYVYEAVTEAIEQDISDINIELVDEIKSYPQLVGDPDIGVQRIRNACLGLVECFLPSEMSDDLVIITDSKYELNGEPFELRFFVNNRRPVLDFLKITGKEANNVDALHGNWISLAVGAKDPDDDFVAVTFTYEDPLDPLDNPPLPLSAPGFPYIGIDPNVWDFVAGSSADKTRVNRVKIESSEILILRNRMDCAAGCVDCDSLLDIKISARVFEPPPREPESLFDESKPTDAANPELIYKCVP